MRLHQSFVEGNAEEINATRDTLKFLGFGANEEPQAPTPPVNGASPPIKGVWDGTSATTFLKALDDHYPSHKKVFLAIFKEGQIAYEHLVAKVGMTTHEVKASLASLTKLARRDGDPERRPANWAKGTYAVWEVDPGLRKVIKEKNLLPVT